MHWKSFVPALLVGSVHASSLRFSCSQLVVERLDPLVNPGQLQTPHVHQIIGGNSFNASMDPSIAPAEASTCTTCTFSEDFSNYWTAILYFRAKNGTFKRVPQKPNVGFEQANGGMTVYYTPTTKSGALKKGDITAFKKGFRMIVGNPGYRTKTEAAKFRQLTYTCLENMNTRSGETVDFPTKPCKVGMMVNVRFPTCWDGQNLDSPDHMAHVAYPSSGTFENNGPCPATHPVKLPQLFFEIIFDTTKFNDKSLWPEDGSQPFVWSFGDKTGYGNHGDYVFGWKDDSLQKAMDANCNVNCPQLKTQSIAAGNKCAQSQKVKEDIDSWMTELPGGMPVQ
ncbi:hypothetical protein CC86DRAFT_357397 [Ophiobolus disseminans]|uniref:DUF1996 domain-containing protein n=1 Tax=Ophiobolus disseminans TaxID=1469910 RepID=A0A6A6ZPZ1_9PLEO|nr:hypothetical protein CC86DRAFT_357397 [Ophiobolus disseminans]